MLKNFGGIIVFNFCRYFVKELSDSIYPPMYRFETMAWFSPFLYAPFYVFAIYAFIFEKEWIRVPGT